MERTVPFLNGCISFVAFIASLLLIVYMLTLFLAGAFDIALLVFDTIFLDPSDRQDLLAVVTVNFLYNFAVLLILMKVFAMLTGYLKTKTVSVKEVVEVAIVTSVLQLLFNPTAYTETTQMVLAAMASVMFAVYAFGLQTFLTLPTTVKQSVAKAAPVTEMQYEDEVDEEVTAPVVKPVRKRSVVAVAKAPKATKPIKTARVAKAVAPATKARKAVAKK